MRGVYKIALFLLLVIDYVIDKFCQIFIGYVTRNKMATVCQSGLWSPSGLSCVEGIALVTGGFNGGSIPMVEVYGPGGISKRLSDNQAIHAHSLDYLDGAVYMCGGAEKSSGLSNICFRGELNIPNKGNILAYSVKIRKNICLNLQCV